VIRLFVASVPGQLLFLTNGTTKKEVVCQVTKSKSYSSASGYVELEFTEACARIWGMRFPSTELPQVSPSAIRTPTTATLVKKKQRKQNADTTRARRSGTILRMT